MLNCVEHVERNLTLFAFLVTRGAVGRERGKGDREGRKGREKRRREKSWRGKGERQPLHPMKDLTISTPRYTEVSSVRHAFNMFKVTVDTLDITLLWVKLHSPFLLP